MIGHLASLSDKRLIVSFAPYTPALSVLKRIGELFPGPSKVCGGREGGRPIYTLALSVLKRIGDFPGPRGGSVRGREIGERRKARRRGAPYMFIRERDTGGCMVSCMSCMPASTKSGRPPCAPSAGYSCLPSCGG